MEFDKSVHGSVKKEYQDPNKNIADKRQEMGYVMIAYQLGQKSSSRFAPKEPQQVHASIGGFF